MAKKRINWLAPFLILVVLLTLHIFAAVSNVPVMERQGMLSSLGWLGGSAILGYVLIAGGLMVLRVPIPYSTIVGLIMIGVGIVLAGISFVVIWTWVKDNWMIAALIVVGAFILYKGATRRAPQQIYYVQR